MDGEINRLFNQLTQALNPIYRTDLPFILMALKTLTTALEGQMDDKQKEVAQNIADVLNPAAVVITLPAGGRHDQP